MSSADDSGDYSLPNECFQWKNLESSENSEKRVFPPDDLFDIDDEEWHLTGFFRPAPTAKEGTRALSPVKSTRRDIPSTSALSLNTAKPSTATDPIPSVGVPVKPPREWPPTGTDIRGRNHPGNIVGFLKSRLPEKVKYVAIEVVSRDTDFIPPSDAKVYPTEWLHISNPIWIMPRDDGFASAVGVPFTRESHWDKIKITIVKQTNGDIYATRWGVTAVIYYAEGGTGGFSQPPVLQVKITDIKPKSRKPENRWKPAKWEKGVSTKHIPVDSPYWSKLVAGLAQTEKGHSIHLRSEVDRVLCIVKLEADFSVTVRRLHTEVKLLGPWEWTDLDQWEAEMDRKGTCFDTPI
ncbi:hypothetical protein ACFFRR_003168 [Megaselia abdita]